MVNDVDDILSLEAQPWLKPSVTSACALRAAVVEIARISAPSTAVRG